ncbi:MAG: TonB family protein [Chitinophagaceae bacterium]
MNKIFFYFFLLFPYLGQAQDGISSISMERTPCFGKCPAFIITIQDNGKVQYIGKSNSLFSGKINGKLKMKYINRLFDKYEDKDFFNLPDMYKVKTSDVSKTHFKIIKNNQGKMIKNANEGPDYLHDLSNEIMELIPKIKWKNKTFQPITQEDDEVAGVQRESSINTSLTNEQAMPTFPNGNVALNDFIIKNLKFPKEAIESNKQGKVICSFVVDEQGKIKQAKVEKGFFKPCDEEALRIINAMPAWIPATKNGKKVSSRMVLPIHFVIKDKN